MDEFYTKHKIRLSPKFLAENQQTTALYPLFLKSDISSSTLPSINCKTLAHNSIFPTSHPIPLQITSVIQISDSSHSIHSLIKSKITKSSSPNSGVVLKDFPRGALRIALTDGVDEIVGIECSLIKELSLATFPGTKVLLYPCLVRRGFLMLEPSKIRVLGAGRSETADDLLIRLEKLYKAILDLKKAKEEVNEATIRSKMQENEKNKPNIPTSTVLKQWQPSTQFIKNQQQPSSQKMSTTINFTPNVPQQMHRIQNDEDEFYEIDREMGSIDHKTLMQLPDKDEFDGGDVYKDIDFQALDKKDSPASVIILDDDDEKEKTQTSSKRTVEENDETLIITTSSSSTTKKQRTLIQVSSEEDDDDDDFEIPLIPIRKAIRSKLPKFYINGKISEFTKLRIDPRKGFFMTITITSTGGGGSSGSSSGGKNKGVFLVGNDLLTGLFGFTVEEFNALKKFDEGKMKIIEDMKMHEKNFKKTRGNFLIKCLGDSDVYKYGDEEVRLPEIIQLP